MRPGTLGGVVRVVGGDLYAGGRRANIPAPGHSPSDRSVSLLLSQGRVVAHGFGAADWRVVLEDLRRRGLVDARGRLCNDGGIDGGRDPPPRPDRRARILAATRLWDEAVQICMGGPAARHLRLRGVAFGAMRPDLRQHGAVPISVYRPGRRRLPALMAGIREQAGAITAVELVYLSPNGHRSPNATPARKTVGVVPPGSAVRLSVPESRLLVAEGVMTTLSAMARFGLPGWALLSAGNLAAWAPPPGVASVLIAADRDTAGQAAAATLAGRLRRAGLACCIATPPPPWGDWNEALTSGGKREREGGEGRR